MHATLNEFYNTTTTSIVFGQEVSRDVEFENECAERYFAVE